MITTTASQILHFLKQIKPPSYLPPEVEVLNPFVASSSWSFVSTFYNQFYQDKEKRVALFGINPGRLGAGLTGVPFTDPIRLEQACGIANPYQKKAELSSRFIYEVIEAYGGSKAFYEQFYFSAISPLGFAQQGKNLNYYDIKNWKQLFKAYTVQLIQLQLPFLKRSQAFSIGMGTNHLFLEELNAENQFFEHIIPLPHPRWIMQYKLREKDAFIEIYLKALRSAN